jgi:hypothetical protein
VGLPCRDTANADAQGVLVDEAAGISIEASRDGMWAVVLRTFHVALHDLYMAGLRQHEANTSARGAELVPTCADLETIDALLRNTDGLCAFLVHIYVRDVISRRKT